MALEDSQTTTMEQENEALIQEALRDAKPTELPGDLTANPVIHRGDETLEAPMTVKEISSAGHVYVWDSRTFEKIPILYYMLPSKLRLRRQDGSFRFTTSDPHRLPKRGSIKCLLHKNSPQRVHFNELGFRVCPKDNITNQHELKQHMLKKHKQEWAAIEDERKERERQEDRQLQHLILGKAVGAKVEVKPIQQDGEFICDVCEKRFTKRIALEGHKRSHNK